MKMMVIEVQTKIGEALYKFIIDDVDEMQALHKAAVLGNPKLYCKLCKNDKFFRLDSNKDKDGNIYVNVVCTACWAKSKLGQYKSKGYFGMILKDTKKVE